MNVTRVLNLRVFIDDHKGLCITVKKTETTQNDEGEKETTTTERTDAWTASSVASAVDEYVTEYLAEVLGETKATPIEEASRA